LDEFFEAFGKMAGKDIKEVENALTLLNIYASYAKMFFLQVDPFEKK